MTTFTELLATVVVNSSALALSHFGVAMAPAQIEKAPPPPVERVIARTHSVTPLGVVKTACPRTTHRPQPIHV